MARLLALSEVCYVSKTLYKLCTEQRPTGEILLLLMKDTSHFSLFALILNVELSSFYYNSCN